MRVLLVGATGSLGSRLAPALLNHNHTVTAYVRNATKLRTLLPEDITSKLTVVEGDAKDSAAIQAALVKHNCDAVVNVAGIAAVMPWQHSDFPVIVKAVVDAAVNVQKTTGKRLRAWFLGGYGVMDYPGKNGKLIVDFVPLFKEHVQNLHLLQSLPADSLAWSLLCPGMMVPASKDKKHTTTTANSTTDLIVSATVPPEWSDGYIAYVPLVGNALNAMANMMGVTTTLEACADFIARDLEMGSQEWVGKKVAPKARTKSS